MVKKLPAKAGDIEMQVRSYGSGRSSRGGHGNPLLHSCLENPTERGTWWAPNSPWGHKELDMTEVT